MSAWVVVPCLKALRDEFNYISPNRDKGADGTIGDTAHTSSSDHTPDEDSDVLRGKDADSINEVHALDIDSTGPWPRSFKTIVLDVVAGEKAKWLNPNDVCRLEYVIYDGKIYSRSRDFNPVDYGGDDPHTNHAHFSARYLTTSENDTRPWGVKEPNVAFDSTDKTYLDNLLDAKFQAYMTQYKAQYADAARNAIALHKEVDPSITVANGYTQAQVDAEAANPSLRIFGALKMMTMRDQNRQTELVALHNATVQALQALTGLVNAEDNETDSQVNQLKQTLQELHDAIDQVPTATKSAIFEASSPDEEIADTLEELLDGLGETRKQSVLALLNS